jgi:hypothetical protein
MSAAPEIVRPVPSADAARPLTAPGPAKAAALKRRLAVRFGHEWFPRLAWMIGRTGRLGLAGLALLLASAVFLLSTYLPVTAEVEALRVDLGAASSQRRVAAEDKPGESATAMRALPGRTEMPAILRQLFSNATQARLAIDAGKYEVNAIKGAAIVRYQIAFPITGPYPQIRDFLDTTLSRMPAVALTDLAVQRKAIADGYVEAQIRMTVFTSTASAPGVQRATEAGTGSDRVILPTHAAALFAQHSWYVIPPAPPPAPPPPPAAPTAPPFPYTLIGNFAPDGQPQVFFLSQGERVIDARVGDRLDGVYQFESAAGGQLVFVYLPLNIRQILSAGASP